MTTNLQLPARQAWKEAAAASYCPPAIKTQAHVQVVRVTFAREVSDERDARSTLTMLAQLAWEQERNYLPVIPTLPDPVAT